MRSNFSFQSLTKDISHSIDKLAIYNFFSDESGFDNRFSLHHSIIFFLTGWENLLNELRFERINTLKLTGQNAGKFIKGTEWKI